MSKLRERIDEIVKPGDLFSELPTEQRIYNKGYADGYCEGLKNKWIPVSEKLPYDEGEYLVIDNNDNCGVTEYCTDIENGEIVGWFDGWENAIAWMALPIYIGD